MLSGAENLDLERVPGDVQFGGSDGLRCLLEVDQSDEPGLIFGQAVNDVDDASARSVDGIGLFDGIRFVGQRLRRAMC